MELQHMLSAEVPRAIGDYASRQLAESDRLRVAAENEADPARRDALINAANAIQDNWSEGGTYRVALHTLSGALSGNVSGALGSFMAASQIGILDDALSDMNVDPTLREAVLLASSFMMGAATNGLQGAINTTGQTANNYLSHAQIDELQSKLTLCNGDKDCQLEAARQYEDISDSNLAQMLADCEQGGPECAAHSSAMQATQDYYRRAIYESSGFSRNVLLSFAVNDLLEQNVPASTVTGKQLEEYGFSPEVVSMAAAIIAGGRRPNSAKPDGAKPTSGGKTDANSKEEFGVPVDMPSRHKLYDIPCISANRQSHVLDGQVNASGNGATGGHWLDSSNIQLVAGSARSIGNGVISAEVKIRNPAIGEFIPKSNNGGRSTLFPPNWDSRKVMSEVTSANSNAVRIGNRE